MIVIIMDPDFLIAKVTTAELGLPASFTLCKVEDELQQLYLQVFTRTRLNLFKLTENCICLFAVLYTGRVPSDSAVHESQLHR